MHRNRLRAVALLVALSLTIAACGRDSTETEEGDARADFVAADVPADWDPSVPTDPIDGMTLTSANVRGHADRPIHELQYDGTGQDGIELFDEYEALALTAGWTEFNQATPLVGSFSMGERNLVVTAFGGDNSQIIVSMVTN